MEKKQQTAEHLKAAGMDLACATATQLEAIDSLSSIEVDMLIGLKTRLDAVSPENTECGNSGGFVW